MKSNGISADDRHFYKEIAKRLRIERLMNNLTQEEMAEIMDVSPRHYGRYESGRYPIPFDKISVLLEAGLDCYYIVTGERYFDRLFIDGLTKMPDEELFELAKDLPESCKSLRPGEECIADIITDREKAWSLIIKIVSYGRNHHNDPYISDTSIDGLIALHAEEIEQALAGNKQYEMLKKGFAQD
ncbi:helix-turn-helix domain-containing protein [Butyrivibrio sp. AE3004]|uniref:helix-turn-helix domain-containing protein n=1 Tax=Butyrivibrio sp. AE3004 TaxID=1506994 RepID=UPI0004948A5B|nr:helix-turn-helix transcriptional regulator [Butyrivibrio sp. AE3004]